MTNLEIKKEIQNVLKYIDNYSIDLCLLSGDGTFEGRDTIYNTLTVWDEDDRSDFLFDTEYSEEGNENNAEDVKRLRAEQKKMATYLKKHFTNIKVMEGSV